MSLLHDWARDWLPAELRDAAIADLQRRLAPLAPERRPEIPLSEAAVQAGLRLNAAKRGIRAWRNNVGVLMDAKGRPVRYGLGNESKQMNAMWKSADLIGCEPILITPNHVGQTLGRLWSREAKAVGGRTDPERLAAQERWRDLLLSLGANAAITEDPGDV